MTRLEEIYLKLKEIDKIVELKEKVWDISRPYEEYEEYMSPEYKKRAQLGREKRMLMSYELKELPKYGTVMSLDDFISYAESGFFIDYDGSGNYVKDGQMSNISIYPSDVKNKSIRKDFDTIIWFNR